MCGEQLPAATYLILLVVLLHAWISNSDRLLFTQMHQNRQPDCDLVKGEWCHAYHKQSPQPVRSLVQGSKHCPGRCSGVGTCDAETGICACPAGWGGPDCSSPRKRPVRAAELQSCFWGVHLSPADHPSGRYTCPLQTTLLGGTLVPIEVVWTEWKSDAS